MSEKNSLSYANLKADFRIDDMRKQSNISCIRVQPLAGIPTLTILRVHTIQSLLIAVYMSEIEDE